MKILMLSCLTLVMLYFRQGRYKDIQCTVDNWVNITEETVRDIDVKESPWIPWTSKDVPIRSLFSI